MEVSLEQKVLQLEKDILLRDQQILKSEAKALQLKEFNDLTEKFPEIAAMKAKLDYELSLAKQFSSAKAFGDYTPEQIYTLMKAGQEMGLQPIEALQMLYIVKGKVRPYGDKMLAVILKNGYRVEYLNETKESVTVRVYNEKGFDVKEVASASDQIMQNSQAAKFALKNKLRFHGIRMIVSFHLSHLFGSCADEFTADYIEYKEVELQQKLDAPKDETTIEEIKEAIENADDYDAIKILQKQHPKISLNGELMGLIAKKKQAFL